MQIYNISTKNEIFSAKIFRKFFWPFKSFDGCGRFKSILINMYMDQSKRSG